VVNCAPPGGLDSARKRHGRGGERTARKGGAALPGGRKDQQLRIRGTKLWEGDSPLPRDARETLALGGVPAGFLKD